MVAATRVSRRTAVRRTGARATQRRGRPPAGTSAAHREVVLDAVFELLVELFTALIHRQAEAADQAVAAALDDDGGADPAATLTAFATNPPRAAAGGAVGGPQPGRP